MGKRGIGANKWEPSNWDEFDSLCKIQCSATEISAFYNVSVDTIERAVKRVHRVTFAEYFKQKRQAGHISIRRALWKKAAAGDMTAIIFYFKANLGFADSMKIKHDDRSQKEVAAHAKEFVDKIETLITELKAHKPTIEDREKKMGLLAATLGISE